jgi:3',5'-cyclic AMP phosphodiesterase CpdA
MKIYAVADLHLGHPENREAMAGIVPRKDHWLILAGDVAERISDVEFALATLLPRFKQVVWVPGNHELWTSPGNGERERGQARYDRLVSLCRSYGVLTPEDPYPVISAGGERIRIAPLFLLYDYSFRPDEIPVEDAVAWAKESGVVCTDELLLHPDPFPSRPAWCHARCNLTEARLAECNDGLPTILVNHFPLRQDLARTPAVPRFSPWCGTRRTTDWHLRFNARVVVSGHLHIRSTKYRDGVRFEEVSLGYPRQWRNKPAANGVVREVWPGTAE